MCSALSSSGIDLNVLVACKSRVLGCALKFFVLSSIGRFSFSVESKSLMEHREIELLSVLEKKH